MGDLAGAFSRRINIQRRLVYQVVKARKTVKVLRMWTHSGERGESHHAAYPIAFRVGARAALASSSRR